MKWLQKPLPRWAYICLAVVTVAFMIADINRSRSVMVGIDIVVVIIFILNAVASGRHP